MKNESAYYFGCYDLAGHYLYAAKRYEGEPIHQRIRYHENNPWGAEVDGGLCPGGKDHRTAEGMNQAEGRALIHHKDGWTALAFWDRSMDHRPNSCSVFMQKGTHDFDSMVKFSRDSFPMIAARFKFPVVNVTPPAPVTYKESEKSRKRSVD